MPSLRYPKLPSIEGEPTEEDKRWASQVVREHAARKEAADVTVQVSAQRTLDAALALLKKIEEALYPYPVCWGPLYQEVADFLDSAQADPSFSRDPR